MNALIQ